MAVTKCKPLIAFTTAIRSCKPSTGSGAMPCIIPAQLTTSSLLSYWYN